MGKLMQRRRVGRLGETILIIRGEGRNNIQDAIEKNIRMKEYKCQTLGKGGKETSLERRGIIKETDEYIITQYARWGYNENDWEGTNGAERGNSTIRKERGGTANYLRVGAICYWGRRYI